MSTTTTAIEKPLEIPAMQPITGSRLVVDALLHCGVKVLFGYPGGAIMPAYDELGKSAKDIRHILTRHEQAAAHAAEGYARATGKVGVCIATSGPGATNLVTGLADAMMDNLPIVAITGQVPTALLGTDAFQETPIIGITRPVTKWNYQIKKGDDPFEIICQAFEIAKNGRPGPVLIDIPKDILLGNYSRQNQIKLEVCHFTKSPNSELEPEIIKAAELINQSKKPLFIIGQGALMSNSAPLIQEIAERAQIPMVSTLHGLSAINKNHPLNFGMIGMHGNYAGNIQTNQADVIIAAGMRFDDRVTGRLDQYARQAKIIHLEIDPAEIGKVIHPEVALVGDAKETLEKILPLIQPHNHHNWVDQFQTLRQKEEQLVTLPRSKFTSQGITMTQAINEIAKQSPDNLQIVADVGQHQMEAARNFEFRAGMHWQTSGGLGTMGFALPAAIGARLATAKPTLAIMGDGCFQMNIQELGTIKQEKIPVKMVILNNSFLGMVRQWQELFFDKNYSSVSLDNPDFVGIAKCYGINGLSVTNPSDLEKSIKEMFKDDQPFLLEIKVLNEENVFPMIEPGKAVDQMRLV